MKYISIFQIQKIKNIIKFKKKIINIYGWIKNKRYSKIGIYFIDLKDGSCINPIQIILKKKKIKKYIKKIKYLQNGCCVKIKGKLIINKKNKKKEIYVKKIKIIGKIKNSKSYPISSKYHSLEHLRKYSHLRIRTYIIESINRIRNTLIFNLHKYLQKNNFYWIPTPIITSLDTEGNSEMFKIINNNKKKKNFFNKEAFLTVSGQLNLETYACSLSKVYNLGPTFRAENSNTNKHLSEFWMLEVEIANSNINNIIKISIDMISYCFKKILKNNYEDINYILKYTKKKNIKYINNIIKKKFIKIDYKDVINILKKNSYLFKNKIKWGIDISNEYENFLTKKYFNSAIIIKNHPEKIKPFYMKKNNKKTVSSIDIIFPNVGEIIGGSEREENLKKLDKNIKKKKLNKKNYWWYRDLRKYGTIKHSGFGLGIERLLMYITNMKNIRDVIPYPRYPNYIKF